MKTYVRPITEPLDRDELDPYTMHETVVRIFFPNSSKPKWFAGTLKSVIFESDKICYLRLKSYFRLNRNGKEEPSDPGICLLTSADTSIPDSIVSNGQPFKIINPGAIAVKGVPVMIIYFTSCLKGENGKPLEGIAILSYRQSDIDSMRRFISN